MTMGAMLVDSPGLPLALPLIFPYSIQQNTSHTQCIFDNDSFSEILNEDTDSYVINPWAWNKDESVGVSRFLVIIVAIATLITNVLVIVTFVREKMMSAINIILIGISVSDTLTVLVPAVAIVYMYADGLVPDFVPPGSCRAWGYLTKYLPTITHNASVWLTVVLAYDRFLAIRHPFLLRRLCLPKKSLSVIVAVYVAAILGHLCRFFDTDYIHVKIVPSETWNEVALSVRQNFSTPMTGNHTSLDDIIIHTGKKAINEAICQAAKGRITCRAVYNPIFGEFQWYEFCYYWFVILFVKFIPCTTMIILDTLMLKSLHHAEAIRNEITVQNLNYATSGSASKNRLSDSRRMTIITIIAVIIVVLVELPIGVILVFWTLSEIHLVREFFTDENSLSLLSRMANMVVYVSYPLIFLLYCSISTRFSAAFCQICCCCFPNKQCPKLEMTNSRRSSDND